VIAALPQPRNSVSLLDSFFLNNRGVFFPSPQEWDALLAVPKPSCSERLLPGRSRGGQLAARKEPARYFLCSPRRFCSLSASLWLPQSL
jgi:hypothetical protein